MRARGGKVAEPRDLSNDMQGLERLLIGITEALTPDDGGYPGESALVGARGLAWAALEVVQAANARAAAADGAELGEMAARAEAAADPSNVARLRRKR